jgi:prepilin-type N-terminal cleavage/methylation domain-containing protein/prepilin-type processing-associated H-X9-DG protein
MKPRTHAFTLIELLVVISIVSLLMAILLPALAKAREAAWTSKCLSNFKQVSVGFFCYMSDNKDYLPPLNQARASADYKTAKDFGMWNCIGPYTGFQEWAGVYTDFGAFKRKYGKFANSIWSCNFDILDSHPWKNSIAESLYMTEISGWYSPYQWAYPRFYPNIPQPSVKIHISHANDWHLSSVAKVGSTNQFDLWRHKTGTPILFADGHARFFMTDYIIENVTDLSNDKDINNFNLN